MTRDEVTAVLRHRMIADGIVWAFASACEQVADDLAPGTGYSAATAGHGRYDQLGDRLDRVFSCGQYAVPTGSESAGLDLLFEGLTEQARRTMPVIEAGLVVRSDLNGSNGWAVGGFRIITHSMQPGDLLHIDWTKTRPTKKLVAKQPPVGPDEHTLMDELLNADQLAELRSQATGPGLAVPTLVLAHAMSRDAYNRELFIGQARFNEDGGPAWVWFESLLDGPELPEAYRPAPSHPSPTDEAPDVPLRLRAQSAEGTQ